MAGFQSAHDDVPAEGMAEWMTRRRHDVGPRGWPAGHSGQVEWESERGAGGPPSAPRRGDFGNLGALTEQRGLGAERSYLVSDSSTFRAKHGHPSWSGASAQAHARPAIYHQISTPRPTISAGATAPRSSQNDEIEKLRREQATFKEYVREQSSRTWWMAIPALAPMVVPLLAEGAVLLTGRLAASQLGRTPFNLLGREADVVRAPLTEVEKNALRAAARKRVAQANGQPASALAGEVHHRVALRFAHLFPNADPNRLANLVSLMREAHVVASRAEAEFVRTLAGRAPTQAEVMAHAMRLDKIIEPYVLRAGVARPPPPP